ncbi:helix-turn-helix transcriptional regulator [Lysinibacillus louembei]|uniref:Helix-turn-helix transcriptional regulator n=1 Tax=Lysinibacillus louembei TaxID=1470088 RepID=A0ABZ0RZ57_9BACI|nr:helix-turn-helix transcriptional regulator [Lysinibacillus louembei]WPK12291.1 helix-turn-helix transcriptional regulator [Lysinibacillus louembei]
MFSERLKKLRKSKNLSQYELADRLGFSRGKLANYEQGTREPDFSTLELIAKFFDVSTDYLLGVGSSKTEYDNKAEKDIAKRLKQFEADLENSDGLAFDGEPLSDEAKESLLESMELLLRQTQRINKKYTPKKYRNDE